ncbi:DUF6634 family protein [Thalassospira alkalitolerans]|uniref:DUF6634 family protein n=1 Tax=Thalassospira alkalitolerans TaxID=1293890 RepID=UPI003AA80652
MGRYSTEMIASYNRALDAVERGSDVDLEGAPTLSDYVPVETPPGRILLFGDVEKHPVLGTALISTSDLVWLDVHAGIARTVSRWYKLGSPATAHAGDLVFVDRLCGCVIGQAALRETLAEKAREFRRLMM